MPSRSSRHLSAVPGANHQSVSEDGESLDFDPFTTSRPGYDPRNFYTRSTDQQGRGIRLNVYVPPYLSHSIATLVQSGRFPAYPTAESFVRDAIYHRLHYLGHNLEGLNDRERKQLAVELARVEVAAAKSFSNDQRAVTVEIMDGIETALVAGDDRAFARFLEQGESLVPHLEEPYKSYLCHVLDGSRNLQPALFDEDGES